MSLKSLTQKEQNEDNTHLHFSSGSYPNELVSLVRLTYMRSLAKIQTTVGGKSNNLPLARRMTSEIIYKITKKFYSDVQIQEMIENKPQTSQSFQNPQFNQGGANGNPQSDPKKRSWFKF